MNAQDIDKLEAGRELDALVGEKVFNYDGICQVAGCSERHDPHYSTDIAAAWLVVEKLLSMECYGFQISYYDDEDPPTWAAQLDWVDEIVEASTAPLAICRAALKALAPVHQDKPSNLTELFYNSLTNRGKQVLADRAIADLEQQEGAGK